MRWCAPILSFESPFSPIHAGSCLIAVALFVHGRTSFDCCRQQPHSVAWKRVSGAASTVSEAAGPVLLAANGLFSALGS